MGRCTVFSWRMHSFLGRMHSFSEQMCSFLLRDCFDPEIMHFVAADYFHPRNHGFVSCLPFTEHVQTLFTLNWACTNSVLGMCRNNLHNLPCFWVLIDNYDTNITWTQTPTRWLNHLNKTHTVTRKCLGYVYVGIIPYLGKISTPVLKLEF